MIWFSMIFPLPLDLNSVSIKHIYIYIYACTFILLLVLTYLLSWLITCHGGIWFPTVMCVSVLLLFWSNISRMFIKGIPLQDGNEEREAWLLFSMINTMPFFNLRESMIWVL